MKLLYHIKSHFSWKYLFITVLFFALACAACSFVLLFTGKDGKTGRDTVLLLLIFVVSVILVSRFTKGYFYGAITAIGAVFAVNYYFTYPYFAFDFSLSGYPLTVLTVFVCIIISLLASYIRDRGQIEIEIEKEKNRANLLRAVSHDIRTPLTSIMGSASAYLDNNEKLSEEAKRELVTDIHEQAVWLVRVVENLLSITRINDSSAEIEKREEMVEEIVGEVMQKFQKQFPSVSLFVDVPDSMMFVPMDAMLIEQVLMNILENAVQHGESTEITLSVSEESDRALFRIADNGTGVQKELLPNLFGTYFVADKEKKPDQKRNMGIGLSVCMSIIKAHGGDMKAYNLEGAVFEFTLPLEEHQ